MCSVVSKNLAVPPVSLNLLFEALSSATTCQRANLSFVDNSPLRRPPSDTNSDSPRTPCLS